MPSPTINDDTPKKNRWKHSDGNTSVVEKDRAQQTRTLPNAEETSVPFRKRNQLPLLDRPTLLFRTVLGAGIYALLLVALPLLLSPLYGSVLTSVPALHWVALTCWAVGWGLSLAVSKAKPQMAGHGVCLCIAAAPYSIDLFATFLHVQPQWHPYLIHTVLLFPVAMLSGYILGAQRGGVRMVGLWWSCVYLCSKFGIAHFLFSHLTQLVWGHAIVDAAFIVPILVLFAALTSVVLIFNKPRKRSLFLTMLVLILATYAFRNSRHLRPLINQPFSINQDYDLVEKMGTHQVLLDHRRSILFLRAQHSLIGGVYRATNDSVYSVFYYHDMHRCLHPPRDTLDVLMVGFGIGVAAETYVVHGHRVTALEIEPAVVHLLRHFPQHVRPELADGAAYVRSAPAARFDVIIHDVFTGGELPAPVFSVAHFTHLRRLLRPNGTLSVNYVGQAHDHTFLWLARVLHDLFGFVRCFAESKKYTFTNHVFFAAQQPIAFRNASERDFLNSEIRWLALSRFLTHETVLEPPPDTEVNADRKVMAMAVEHWQIMRDVIPREIWMEY